MNPYTLLANHIILQAVQDYRKSLRGLQIRKTIPVDVTKQECEDFFTSEWFSILTKVDGKQIMRRLQEEYANESNPSAKYKKANRNSL